MAGCLRARIYFQDHKGRRVYNCCQRSRILIILESDLSIHSYRTRLFKSLKTRVNHNDASVKSFSEFDRTPAMTYPTPGPLQQPPPCMPDRLTPASYITIICVILCHHPLNLLYRTLERLLSEGLSSGELLEKTSERKQPCRLIADRLCGATPSSF